MYSLGIAEGHLKVLPAVAGAQGAVVKGFREKIVHQGTKCHTITPAGWKILNIHMLRERTDKINVEAVMNKWQKHSQSRRILSATASLHKMSNKHTVGLCGSLAHLIWAGLGTTPVEQHLLDWVCIGYTKAGGTLDPVYLGDCLISRAKRKVCINIYMLWRAPFLSLVATPLCLSLPASVLLKLLYHGFAGLHGGRLRHSLSPHQLLASVRLPSLDGG